jgi:F-type H+-transporting ATPase subunit b
MKIPGIKRNSRLPKGLTAFIILTVLTLGVAGIAMSAEAEHGAGAEHHGKGWAATDTYKVINFTLLAAGLFLLLRKPVKQALSDRIQGIKDQLADLEAKKEAAEAELARYNEKFQELDKEAEKLVAQYIQQGEEAKAKIIKEAEAAAEKLEEQARRNIEHEFGKAKQKLQEEVLEAALSKAETMIKSKISKDDQERLVDEYLEKVVA